MTRILLASVVILGSLALLARSHVNSSQAAGGPDETKKAVRKVLDDQTVAWNKGDLRGFMEGYWQSPDLRFYSGKDVTSGWQATLERYQKKYQKDGKKMGELSFTDLDIELLGADHALVRGRWNLVLPKEKVGGLFTLVCKKLPAGWRIVHDHTS